MADLAVWQRTIVDEEGNVIPGAEIEVRREEDGSLATLYADRAGETPLANPLAADMSGFVRFFAQGDAYTITAVGAGSTRTWRFDPTGRLQEFDRVSEALVADDAADLLSARSNLGTFSTVADVENSHIPPVLESIRTNGYYSPGDGGGAELVESAESPITVQSKDGRWWTPASPVLRPQMFALHPDGTVDDTDRLQAIIDSGRIIDWGTDESRRYRVKSLTIPPGSRWHGVLQIDLDESATPESAVLIGEGSQIEAIDITCSSAGSSRPATIGDRARIGRLTVKSDTYRAGTILTSGNGVHIDTLETVNINRPLGVHPDLEGPRSSGLYIGRLIVDGYIRALRLDWAENWRIDYIHARGRSPDASNSPGHNGILFMNDPRNGSLGTVIIEDAAEHAVRFGGGEKPGGGRDINFDLLRVVRSGGCAFKINPADLSTTENISVGRLEAIDVGEGTSGGNKEAVRLTHARNIRIGWLSVIAREFPYSCTRAVQIADTLGVWIGTLYAPNVQSGGVRLWSEQDGAQGPVRNVQIDNVIGGGDRFFDCSYVDFEWGDIFFPNVNWSNFEGSPFTSFSAGAAEKLTGRLEINASVEKLGSLDYTVAGPVPQGDNVCIVVSRDNRYTVGTGRPNGNFNLEVSYPTDPGNTPDVPGFYVDSRNLPGGLGAYGGGYFGSAPGASRRGFGIVAKQTWETNNRTGIAFLVRGHSTTAHDQLIERMLLDHAGNLSIEGAISKGAGTFKIDHPLDPENRHLIHGFIEGPRYDLIYRGRVKLEGGNAVVDIDAASGMTHGTFAALTQNAEVVSLNNLDGFARVKATAVEGGTFEIICEDTNSTDAVAWVVMAERADRFIREDDLWTDEHGRLVPEWAKTL